MEKWDEGWEKHKRMRKEVREWGKRGLWFNLISYHMDKKDILHLIDLFSVFEANRVVEFKWSNI